MLRYLDRAPAELDPVARLCVGALRLWTAEMRAERCPANALCDLFRPVSGHGAIWPAHNLFYWIVAHAARPLHLGCPCCGRVSDDEAALLTAIFATEPAQIDAALGDMLRAEGKAGAQWLAQSLRAELSLVVGD